MIPILFDRGETAFTSNGLGRLADCLTCTVTEERNGIYECQFTYPITGDMYSEIQEGRIIGVIHDDVHDIQPFDIYSRSAPLNGVVTFYAHHISYRLGSIVLKPMTALSCAGALAAIPDKTYTDCPFTFWTDKTTTGNWKNEVPNAVRAILGGQKGSILDVFGTGEYEWDKWTVKLYASRGVDQGVSIRYGVNLTDLKHDIDISGAYSAAVPYWKSTEDDAIVTLDSGYVKVALPQLVPWTDHNGNEITDNNGNVICFNAEASAAMLRMTVMDLSEAFEEQPTQEQLRAEALRRLTNSEAWLPSENITVKFVDLSHTEEYKDVAALQRVRLCDRVSVYCGPMGVSAVSMQVIRVMFNVLTERYDEIELGKPRISFAQAITETVEEATKDLPSVSMMQRAINNATDQITGAKGGHLLDIFDADGKRQEMVIMDTEDVNTAVKVWRMNMGGFGFSSNGYNGPYALAITQDGAIVADFITTGTLIANIIKAGILSDSSGKNFWDMVTGEFSLSAATTVGGSTVDSIAQSKVSNLDESLNQQSVFNRLTNNGQTQGIYLKDGKLYVNATFIDTGFLSASIIKGDALTLGGNNNVNGTLIVKNASNATIGTWNADGINATEGSLSLTKKSGSYSNKIVIGNSYSDTLSSTYTEQYQSSEMKLRGDYLSLSRSDVGGSSIYAGTVTIRPHESIWTSTSSDRHYPRIDLKKDSASFYCRLEPGSIFVGTSSQNFEAGMSAGYMSVNVTGDFTVSGRKSRSVTTDQYSDRLLYCYETPTPMFGDIGEGVISDDGLCYVWLDAVFAQTITTDQYQVFLQRYGEGECYVKERRGGCFIVAGTPGLSFGWEVKAKQRDYDQLRLEKNEDKFTVPAPIYGEDAAQHIDEIRKEREAA